MSSAFLKYVSVTPEPKRPPAQPSSTFLTDLCSSSDLLEVCSALGISACELEPKTLSDFCSSQSRLAGETRFQHFEELRRVKLAMVQQALLRRQSKSTQKETPIRTLSCNREPTIVTTPQMSGIRLWTQRYDNACVRLDTVRKVRENKEKIRIMERAYQEELIKLAHEREKKLEDDRKTQEAAIREKVKNLQKHRETILKKMQKVREMQARDQHEYSPFPPAEPSRLSLSAEETLPLRPSFSLKRSTTREYQHEDVSVKLAQIQSRLEKGLERAAASKKIISLTARVNLESEEIRTLKRNAAEEAENRLHLERLQKLQQASERHIKNKEMMLNETVRKLSQSTRWRVSKVRDKLIAKEGETKTFEATLMLKDAERTEYIQKLHRNRYFSTARKAKECEAKRKELEEVRGQMHTQEISKKQQILLKLQKAEASVNSINMLKEKLKQLHNLTAIDSVNSTANYVSSASTHVSNAQISD